MSEAESAHGKLSKVDREWNSTRFLLLLAGTVLVALVIIYSISSLKTGDWTYSPFAHDLVQHTIETSAF